MSDILTAPEKGVVLRFTSPDGRWVDLVETFLNGRISIGPAGEQTYDDVYDFPTIADAIVAFADLRHEWKPEPTGWIRHMPSARRRPDGDPTREYVRE